MTARSRVLVTIATLVALCASRPAAAQDTTSKRTFQPSGPTVSGIVVGSYQYLMGGTVEDANQFLLDRAYVNVRGRPSERLSYRITSDIFQSGDGNGWTLRAKYAYLDYLLGSGGGATTIRAGMLQTVTIEQHETFWPRWLGPVPLDRHGFFQSADVGVAAQTVLPARLGEVYAHVVNGPGYSRRETDRFKDYAARASLTPLSSLDNALLRSFTVSGWFYDGARGSQFANADVNAVGEALTRDRWGAHAGIRSPRLIIAAEYSRRVDDTESGDNTPVDPRIVTEREGSLASGFAIVRPVAFFGDRTTHPLALVGRYDRVNPTIEADETYHYLLAGGFWDVNSRFSVGLHYQEQFEDVFGSEVNPLAFRGVFANFQVTF